MKTLRITAAVITVAFAACASAGNKVAPAKVTALQKGRTTRAEVIASLGAPNGTTIDSTGKETLTYVYSQSSVKPATFIPLVGAFAGGADVKTNTVTVKLDARGLVEEYTSAETNVGTNAFGQ